MRMIAGIMRPTAGQVKYDGLPITELKEKVPGPVWLPAAGFRVLSGIYSQRLSLLRGGIKGTHEKGHKTEGGGAAGTDDSHRSAK